MTCKVCDTILSPYKCPCCQVRQLCPECSLKFADFYVCVTCHYLLTQTDTSISEIRAGAGGQGMAPRLEGHPEAHEEYLTVARDARARALGGRAPAGLCGSVCAAVRAHLFWRFGLGPALVWGAVAGESHCWLETAEGTVLDPTASQFGRPDGSPMPDFYVGRRPGWYAERGRYAPLS